MKKLTFCALAAAVVLFAVPVQTRDGGSTSNDPHDQIHAMTETPTFTAVQSGFFSELATWQGRTLPGEGARIVIPDGLTVTFDLPSSPCYDWIRVDHEATLRYATGVPTELRVKSLYAQGTYEQGTTADPITSSSRLTFCGSDGTFDHFYDPLELSQGLISMKAASIVGQDKTPFVSFSVPVSAGATQIPLDEIPAGWQAGDLILVVGQEKDNDETRNLVSVEGNTITLSSGLSIDKTPGAEGWMKLYVANLSRNVKITSEYEGATNLRKQGHVMFMAGGNAVKYTEIYRAGRTNLTVPTDPLFIDGVRTPQLFPLCVPAGELVNGQQLENPRGRYPLHFHKAGPQSAKSVVDGVVVRGDRSEGDKFTSERWGIAVHSSHADVKNSIVYDIDGAQFITEEGDEIGEFSDNLAVRSYGNNSPFAGQPSNLGCMQDNYPEVQARRRNTVGHDGNGFWVQGGGVTLLRNIAQGQTTGIDANTSDNAQNADPQYQQPVKLLIADWWGVPDYGLAWAGNETEFKVTDVPTRLWDNYIFGGRRLSNQKDSAIFYNVHQLNSMLTYPGIPDSEHRGTRAWNVRRGMESEYTAQLNLQDVVFVAGVYSSVQSSEAIAIGAQNGRQHTLTNVRADGFADSVFKLGGASSQCFNSTTNGQNAQAKIGGVNTPCQIQ